MMCQGGSTATDFDGSPIDVPCGGDAIVEIVYDDEFSRDMRDRHPVDAEIDVPFVGTKKVHDEYGVQTVLLCERCTEEFGIEAASADPAPFTMIVLSRRDLPVRVGA